jgi:HEPN domain-containing protein
MQRFDQSRGKRVHIVCKISKCRIRLFQSGDTSGKREIFLHATAFHESDHRLRNTIPLDKPEIILITQPSMVLSAFASELYLKCLLCAEHGKIPNGHNLKTLFLQLATSTRKRIDELWGEYIRQPHRQATLDYIRSMSGGENIQSDLLYALKISANAFIELRYFYENQQAFFILDEFPDILRKVTLENYPHWAAIPATQAIALIR